MKRFGYLILLFFILVGLGKMPYANLVINSAVFMVVLWIAITVLWRISYRIQFKLSLAGIVLALGLTLVGRPDTAESMGNIVYFLLWIGLAGMIKERAV